jgi:hypothetical protein
LGTSWKKKLKINYTNVACAIGPNVNKIMEIISNVSKMMKIELNFEKNNN